MSFLFTVLTLGFLLGMRHATDPDHVTAVITIVSKQKKLHHSSLVGIFWGIGHALTVTAVAIPIIFFSLTIPTKLGIELEFIVGAMLAFLGLLNISGFSEKFNIRFFPTVHSHSHISKGKVQHSHKHVHFNQSVNENIHHLELFHIIRPLVVGLIHGLAGSAAIALLIVSTIKDIKLTALYLLVFHLGVIIGMMLITTVFGVSVLLIKKRSEKMHRYLVATSGICSLIFGIYIMYQTFFDITR